MVPFSAVYQFIPFFRWIKFEEDVEEGGERWSKPHVATLSLHSLFELRCSILSGTVILDMEVTTMQQLAGQSTVISLGSVRQISSHGDPLFIPMSVHVLYFLHGMKHTDSVL